LKTIPYVRFAVAWGRRIYEASWYPGAARMTFAEVCVVMAWECPGVG